MTTRRTFLTGSLAAALPLPALAQQDPGIGAGAGAAASDRFPLWPKAPPGADRAKVSDKWVKRSPTGGPDDIAWPHVGVPMLSVLKPARPNGAAVLICPGGGYVRVAVGRNPGGISRWFADRGVTAFELLYRLPHDRWPAGADVALQDAQRAMRLIRAGAGKRWSVDPARVAITGFSAGGHVAARLAARSTQVVYAPTDAADRLSAAPIVAGLFYPVITMFDDGVHAQSRRELLGTHAADPDWQRRYSAQVDLPADMPPTFVACNADDPVVPFRNSVLMAEALRAARVPAELHVFEKGGHGPPRRTSGAAVPWQQMFTDWAGDHGWPA
ncbi:alpha/beta hydrolase [Sphingomonas aracearum]|uniref:Alpha/beta hydrolase n=1 Tax=Sphingomonas aracearum TaxID=2283317 RepID=A0A369VZI1_9SPHN|nr:alpha/beta hydrolase [Sphingomonas aracearum]RDE07209.1 alpha/beta hydrolase [Sphingomonas aracearum]